VIKFIRNRFPIFGIPIIKGITGGAAPPAVDNGAYFAPSYFGGRYFGRRYFN
jgi:hypothetical protein